MIKFANIVFFSLFLTHSQVLAQIRNDDILHYSAGVVTGTAGAFIASELSNGKRIWTFAGAVGAGILAGTMKEYIDKRNNGDWSNRDLGATFLGGLTAGVTIDLLTSRKRKRKQRAYMKKWDTRK